MKAVRPRTEYQAPFAGALGDGINRAGGFIQDDDARIRQHRTSEADELPLAERQRGAAFCDRRVQFLRQRVQQVEAVQCFQVVRTSASVASGRASRMLSNTEPVNK